MCSIDDGYIDRPTAVCYGDSILSSHSQPSLTVIYIVARDHSHIRQHIGAMGLCICTWLHRADDLLIPIGLQIAWIINPRPLYGYSKYFFSLMISKCHIKTS